MKQSIKSMAKRVLPVMKASTKEDSIVSEAVTQVILICDRMLWTDMSESYLNTNSYGNYKLVLKNEEERIVQQFKESNKRQWVRTALRTCQWIHFREIGMDLARDQITASDFKWKEQLRMYISDEDIFVCHFDGKISYLCEYRPPLYLNVPTNTSTRYLY
jgi:hypothetical protein